MPQNDVERTVAHYRQTSLTDLPAGGNWDTDATVVEFLAIEVTVDGLGEGTVPNLHHRRRALATPTHLPALRSGSGWGFKLYLSGSQVTTANDSAAATFILPEMLENAWGGLHLGFASLVVAASTTVPEITVGQGVNHPAGAFIFGIDANGVGEFLAVDSVTGDVLTLRTTAANPVASVGAVIANFPHTRALPDGTHPSNTTHAFYVRGEDAGDNYEILGGKLNATGIESNGPGEDAKFIFEGMHTNFNSHAVTRRALTGTPQGPAGPVVGRSGTAIRVAPLGTPAMSVLNAHTFTFASGITATQVPGVGGQQGVLRYAYTPGDETIVEVVVDYDKQQIADFEAQQYFHVMIQVGDVQSDAWGIYLARCILLDDPGRVGTSDQTTMTLRFQAQEFEGTTHTEGTTNFELERARFSVLTCA